MLETRLARSVNPLGLLTSLMEESSWPTLNLEQQTGLSLSEDEGHVFVEAAMPGLKPDQIEVSLDKGTLWIKGEKKEEEEDKKKKYYRKALSSFSYCLSLPGQIDESHEPRATYENGVMKVTFDKAQKESAKKIKIEAKS